MSELETIVLNRQVLGWGLIACAYLDSRTGAMVGMCQQKPARRYFLFDAVGTLSATLAGGADVASPAMTGRIAGSTSTETAGSTIGLPSPPLILHAAPGSVSNCAIRSRDFASSSPVPRMVMTEIPLFGMYQLLP